VTFTFDLQSGWLQDKEVKERNMFMVGKVGFYEYPERALVSFSGRTPLS
jgi:hypothetical protein